MKRITAFGALALLLVTSSAFAHPGHNGGLAAGLSHPFSGLDHLLAMFAVGLWAAQQKGKAAFWLIPGAFVTTMLVGSLLGLSGIALPYIESGVATSVLILGLLVAAAARMQTSVAMSVVALFALLHGYAHGSEMPLSASLTVFITGFVLSTAVLHGLGMVTGFVLRNKAGIILRIGGAAVAAAGAWLTFA
jgi:urease accessory protein